MRSCKVSNVALSSSFMASTSTLQIRASISVINALSTVCVSVRGMEMVVMVFEEAAFFIEL